MKKLMTLLLTLALLATITACGGSAKEKSATNDQPTASSSETKTDSSKSDQATASKNDSETKADADATKPQSTDSVSDDTPTTIPESVIFDDDFLKVTATGYDAEAMFGPEIKLSVENKTDTDLMLQINYFIINGYMIEELTSIDIPAAGKVDDSISIFESSLLDAGIVKPSDIQVDFAVLDPETYETIQDTGFLSIPTDSTGQYQQAYDDSGDLLLEADGLRIVSKGMTSNDFGKDLVLYIENNSDQILIIQTENVQVNDLDIEPIFSTTIIPNTRAIGGMSFPLTSLEEIGVAEISKIQIQFDVLNDSYDKLFLSDPIVISF